MCTDGEPATVCNEFNRKAAKEHRCSECRRAIAKGENYREIRSLFEGSWSTVKVCAHCLVGLEWLAKECNGYAIGGVREEIREHAEEYQIVPLWRLTVGMNRKWSRFDGAGLMALPKMPPLSVEGEDAN